LLPASNAPAFNGWHALLIILMSVPLVIGCWDAPFTNYDDTEHVTENAGVQSGSMGDLFSVSTHFPVTQFSYIADRAVFAGWMPKLLGSWAPGSRAMTLLYHALAALLVWQILLLLRVGPAAALFGALVFAGHPLACETVCWISERKNALAALFGFASVWVWLRLDGRVFRMPLVIVFYLLALLSKPSALGMLPIFMLLEFFGGPAGLVKEGAMRWKPQREWLAIIERITPLLLVSLVSIAINLNVHKFAIIQPPGGSLFTAMLTDIEIVMRYLRNLALPFWLSAVYAVQPATSAADSRVWIAGFGLVLLIALSVAVAENRRRAVFGWLWFFAAMGTSLNLIAIAHLMQDRYIYLSTPGFVLVLIEVSRGLRKRLQLPAPVLPVAAAIWLMLLCGLSVQRGYVWRDMKSIFFDAVNKQPNACYAWYGLGSAYGEEWNALRGQAGVDPKVVYNKKIEWLRAWQNGVDPQRCPDMFRYSSHQRMAVAVGEELNRQHKSAAAEIYFKMAAYPPRETPKDPVLCAEGLNHLSIMALKQNQPERALRLAQEAFQMHQTEYAILAAARAGLMIARGMPQPEMYIKQIRADLKSIDPASDAASQVNALLQDPLLKQ